MSTTDFEKFHGRLGRVEFIALVAAMIAIRDEIRAIERGEADPRDNVLKHAPHPAELLLGDWTRPYSREAAFFPLPWIRDDKYWPPVGRVDNVYGDRNVVCSCPPVEEYAQAAE